MDVSRLIASLRMIDRSPSRLARQAGAAAEIAARYLRAPFAEPHSAPILVLGMPKSGTTVMAALLARYGGLSATLDLWPRLHRIETLEGVHAGTLPLDAFVRRFAVEFSRDLVKDPAFTFLYPELRSHFPDARFVMVMRDPRAMIRSVLNRLQLPGDRSELAAEDYRRMRPIWEGILTNRWLALGGANYVERLAHQWAAAARTYLANTDDMTLIRFEGFARDKPGEIARLAAALDIEQTCEIESQVDVAFQPPGNRSARWDTFFGARNLAAIESITARERAALGYEDAVDGPDARRRPPDAAD